MHGGHSPSALIKAKQSLALLRMPAIEGLFRVMEHTLVILEQHAARTCPACTYPSGDVDEIDAVVKNMLVITKTAQTILDRCDMGPKATLEVKQGDGDMDINLLTDYERDELFSKLAAVRECKERFRRRLSGLPEVVTVVPSDAVLLTVVDSKSS